MRRALLLLALVGCSRGESPATPADAAAPPVADAGVADLVRQLKAQAADARVEAARRLGEMGATARDAVGALAATLQDPETRVRLAALDALHALARAKVALAEAIEPLTAALKDATAAVRARAADVLGRIGDAAFVEPLRAALADADATVRAAAARALGGWARRPRPPSSS
ncbi:MAG: HEAT repeat domain-containing protein [Myxococcales bacterium]|nr:HEAT repeat domain-containing protein [Myxococcales bacterium]